MTRATILLRIGLLLTAGCIAFALWPRGHESRFVTKLSQPFSISVSAPVRPFGTGALYLIVEGRLDGDATLNVISNRSRDPEAIPLVGPHVSVVHGGAEDWVDDV